MKIIHKWKTFKTDPNPPRSGHPIKFSPRSDRVMLREMADNPKTSLETLETQLTYYIIKFMTEQSHKYGTRMACLEGLPEESLFY